MRIIVEFINGTEYWQQKVLASAKRASEVLSDPDFLDLIEMHTQFDFTDKTPAEVAKVIENAGDVRIRVGFYRGWFWSRAIAYEADGEVHFNTRKEGQGAGSIGNVAHEVLHALGFSHSGNAAAGNQNTVPYWVGNEAELLASHVAAPKAVAESVTT